MKRRMPHVDDSPEPGASSAAAGPEQESALTMGISSEVLLLALTARKIRLATESTPADGAKTLPSADGVETLPTDGAEVETMLFPQRLFGATQVDDVPSVSTQHTAIVTLSAAFTATSHSGFSHRGGALGGSRGARDLG